MRFFFACNGYRRRKPDKVSGIVSYNGSKLLRITYYITSALASLLLVLSISILWLVYSMPARLGIITGFNVLISLCLTTLTTASRAEVFAVTARYVLRVASRCLGIMRANEIRPKFRSCPSRFCWK